MQSLTNNHHRSLSRTQNKMQQSLRTGHHATVYEVRRDPELLNKDVIREKNKPVFPFISGSRYKGDWQGDQKNE
jgi:predicted transcriptional regulator